LRVLFVSFVVIILDQVSKLIIKGVSVPFFKINFPGMFPGQRIPVIDGLFNITFVENPGIAFGIYPGDSFKLLLCLFTITASVLLCWYLYKSRNKSFRLRLSLAIIIGGALGNLIDRVFYGVIYGYGGIFHGKVVDFFNLKFFDDMAVTFGVIMYLFALEKKKTDEIQDNINVESFLADDKK
jgi:signal peptidase II